MRAGLRLLTMALCVGLTALTGCGAVHQRQALYPNRPGRVADGRPEQGRTAASAAINLRVEAEEGSPDTPHAAK
jgi:hypothetical protein